MVDTGGGVGGTGAPPAADRLTAGVTLPWASKGGWGSRVRQVGLGPRGLGGGVTGRSLHAGLMCLSTLVYTLIIPMISQQQY